MPGGVFAALALAHRDADVIGPVRITCEPLVLRLDLCGVRRHARQFAPVGVAREATLTVPYSAVRALVRKGPVLLLVLDPRVASPYLRFALGRFAEDGAMSALTATVARLRLERVLVALLAALAGGLAFLAAPAILSSSAVVRAGFASLVLFASFAVFAKLRSVVFDGGARSLRRMRELEAMIGERLGVGEASVALADADPQPEEMAEILGVSARPGRLAMALFVAALGVSVTAFVLRRYAFREGVRLPVAAAVLGLTADVLPLGDAARVLVTPVRVGCRCLRAEAPLWTDGVPQLSVLVSPRRGLLDTVALTPDVVHPIRNHNEVAPDPMAPRVDFDVIVINNGTVERDTVSLVLTFARRSPSGERIGVMERGLHYPGRLRSAQAVKWRVRARGSEVRLTLPDAGLVGAEHPVGNADGFFALHTARIAAVRLHGAMMLGYLGDARAEGSVSALTQLSPLEDGVRALLADALTPLTACDISLANGQLRACVHNGSSALLRQLAIAEPGKTSPPSWQVRDLFFPARGLIVELPLEGVRKPPRALRVTADGGLGTLP